MPQTSVHPPGPNGTVKSGDATLVRLISEGDVTALGGLFDQMARPVYSIAMQLLRNHDEAEDIVESTLWDAWQEATQLAQEPDPRGWLLGLGRRRALDRLRARRHQREDLLLDKRQIHDLVALPAAVGGEYDVSGTILESLESLDANTRKFVELGYFRGLSQVDISELTGKSASDVKAAVRAALEMLRPGERAAGQPG